MDWLGIGVLIIGIAFAVLVIFLLKPISKLSSVLASLQETTDRLPTVLGDVTHQATEVLQTGNSTLENVNVQVNEISPLFHIVGDAGEASRKFTSEALNKVNTFKKKTAGAKDFTKRERYEGVYGLLSFLYFLSQRKKELKEAVPVPKAK